VLEASLHCLPYVAAIAVGVGTQLPSIQALVSAQVSTAIGQSRIGVAPRLISYQGLLRNPSSGDPVADGIH